MTLVNDIKKLLDEGNYLEADRLADEHRIKDCRNICDNIQDITEISDLLDHSISLVSSLEDKIKSYDLELRNVKETAFQMEEKEHAVQAQCKNLSDTCKLIEDLLENARIPEHIQLELLEGPFDDPASIERIERALADFVRVLRYRPDPALMKMKCAREQYELTNSIKSKFSERFYQYITSYLDKLLSGFTEEFINTIYIQPSILPEPDAPPNHLSHLTVILKWLAKEDELTFKAVNDYYSEIRIKVKRTFDNIMKQQLDEIREFKAPKQVKCGILEVVKNFEEFATQMESFLAGKGFARRRDIDRWYPELVTELFKAIDRTEHNKTPTEMIRLENYNYLHDVLRSLKVPCLEAQRKEANQQYRAALSAYVARYFGRPLEKLNTFFDGVQAKVAQGVKEEEISFQLAFSKQELRKVLQMVTLKEVRKGLEEISRRIEKHASEPDSNLIQVIWHAMQEEFLKQYKAIEGMIERCYPSSNLSLTFSINDVLQVFSDIAQSH